MKKKKNNFPQDFVDINVKLKEKGGYNRVCTFVKAKHMNKTFKVGWKSGSKVKINCCSCHDQRSAPNTHI